MPALDGGVGPPRGARWTALALELCAALLAARGLAVALRLLPSYAALSTSQRVAGIGSLGAALVLALVALGLELVSARRAAPGLASLLRLAFVALLSTWAGVVLFGPNHATRPLLWMALGWAAGTFAVLRLAARLPRSPRGRRMLRLVELTLFTLCLSAVLAEGALRLIATVRPGPLFAMADAGPQQLLALYRREPGYVHLGFPVNSHGMADEEFTPAREGERVVVTLGDSFSMGVVPHPWHFTTVAEEGLARTRVHNMGVTGIGPPEYLEILRHEALPLDPDLVVVDLYVGNDVDFAAHRPSWTFRWGRLLLDRRNVLLYQVPRRLAILSRERRARAGAGGAVGAIRGGESEHALGSRQEYLEAMPWIEDWRLEQPTFSEQAHADVEWRNALQGCRDDARVYAALFAALERILEACGTTPCAFLILPAEFQVEDPNWERILRRSPEAALERDLPQRKLRAFLEQRGVAYVDLLARFRSAPLEADGGRHLYLARDTHFNARGNRLAAAGLVELVERVLGP